MASDANDGVTDYYQSRRSVERREHHRRWDRRAQIGVAILAIAAGVVAGRLGTHQSWERSARVPTSTVRPPAGRLP